MAIKISIVIPTFNRPALLRKCLDMLVIQDFPPSDYEIIVVSDGPVLETV
jgi:glycosyltransferase involved in cell wall biosynthesis